MAMRGNESRQLDLDLNVEPSDPNDEAAEVNVEATDLNPKAPNDNNSRQLDFDLNVEPSDPNDEAAEVNVEATDLNRKAPNDNISNDLDECSVCWDPVLHNTDHDSQTPVTLKCGHKFHLACIGSAFNKKKIMECPYCRQIEPGHWKNGNDLLIEEEDFGIYIDMVLFGTEFCPFNDLQHHTHEVPTQLGPSILFHDPACLCAYAECVLTIPQPSPAVEVTENSDLSSQLTTGSGDVPDLNDLPVDPLLSRSNQSPVYQLNSKPSNRKTFWTIYEPGVLRGRHYFAHPSLDHSSLFGRSNSSMTDAAMALPCSGSTSVASSSTSISYLNNNSTSSHLGESSSAPVSQGQGFPYGRTQHARGPSSSRSTSYGSNFVNENGFNRFDIWERVPFLEPAQQQQIENKFYRIIYNGDI